MNAVRSLDAILKPRATLGNFPMQHREFCLQLSVLLVYTKQSESYLCYYLCDLDYHTCQKCDEQAWHKEQLFRMIKAYPENIST